MKTSFKFLSRDREDFGQLFMWLQIFYFKSCRENLIRLLFCPDLSLSRSTDPQDCNLHLLFHCFQSSCSQAYYFVFSFECKHVCFNVKSYTESHRDKKGIKKAVMRLVSVHVPASKTLL